jgi:HAD superfamily hydrolase (TIGR01509 family)
LLAVLSNSPPRLSKWLADWGLLDLFHVVVCSGDEGLVKPDPAIFDLTLARLGVDPEESVFIDDTLGHVQAAENLGIHGIYFTTSEALVRDLDSLLELAE